MKEITYEEARERIKDGLVVYAAYDKDSDGEYGDEENVLTLTDLAGFKEYDDVSFRYDDEAEKEAEEIFASLKEDVKVYLHRLLVNENIPSW